MASVICTFHWGTKYGPEYMERWLRGAANWFGRQNKRLLVILLEDDPLTEVQGCFARLRMFDPEWCAKYDLHPGDRVLVTDLDLIFTGPIDPLFEGPDPFVILQGVNSSNPCPYNGSVWRLDIGYRPDVWSDFSLEAAAKVPYDAFPDDQAWFAHKLPGAGKFGPENGVYAFQKPGWPKGEALPRGASIVAFPGWRDPSGWTHLNWVKESWLGVAA